jgi:hypothetical protein
MREQIEILNTEQTADNRPLTDAELNDVSGGADNLPLWEPLTQNITETVWWGGFNGTFLPFA